MEIKKDGLRFLGVGSAFNTELGNNSGYLLKKEALLLIDCGSNIFQRLKRVINLSEIKQVEIILTHLHPDHSGSLGDLIFYLFHKVGLKPILHFPAGVALRQLLSLQGVREEYYELDTAEKFQTVTSISVQAFSQEHSPTISSFGYTLQGEGISFFYSGDSNGVNQRALEMLKAGEIDFFYQDTCSYKIEGAGHTYIRDLEDQIPEEYRSRVVCMHLDEDFDRKLAEQLGFLVATV